MTVTDRPQRSKRSACAREGCKRTVRGDSRHPTCSFLCSSLVSELEEAERVTIATGDGGLWAAAVALNDAVNEYRACDQRAYYEALESGFTAEQWREIKRGTQ